jgi:hypothetical protein
MRPTSYLVPSVGFYALSVFLCGPVLADEPAPTPARMESPARGAQMRSVESRLGAPTERHAAVGRPPITRWDYPELVVFFEGDRVIHSIRLKPAP